MCSTSEFDEPELNLSNDLLDSLLYVIDLKNKNERLAALKEKFACMAKDDLLGILAGVLNISCDYAASCDETLELHLVTTGDLHPYTVEKLITPSFEAAINGLKISKKAPNKSVLCESCAYRCGTLANHSSSTQADLAYAIESKAIFYCHQEIENLDYPTEEDKKRMRPCRGWAQDVKGLKNEK
ncbi:hypothetical protein [Acinetobacter venetianus]|uniref:hypothetical protein n=1 Tax=Acinetobacter venetianus TaxID=52133 RepID=UPI003A9497DA